MNQFLLAIGKIQIGDQKMLTYSIIAPTVYGQMIINRHDINQSGALIKTGKPYDFHQIEFAIEIAKTAPENSIFLDIGANFGCYSLALANEVQKINGVVHAYEAQRAIAYMLSGTLALNGLENCIVHNVCVGDSNESIDVPRFDYHSPMNFGSIEFGESQNEILSQMRKESTEKVNQIRIDDSNFINVRYMKIDVEGMEESVLNGAISTIDKSRPIVQIEHIKSNKYEIQKFFINRDYRVWTWGSDYLCISRNEANGLNLPLNEISLQS